jgi:hypothetical protein
MTDSELVQALVKNQHYFGNIRGASYEQLANAICAALEEIRVDQVLHGVFESISSYYEQFQHAPPRIPAEEALILWVHPVVEYALLRSPKIDPYAAGYETRRVLGIKMKRATSLNYGRWRIQDVPGKTYQFGCFEVY